MGDSRRTIFKSAMLAGMLSMMVPTVATAASVDLGKGFRDLGVATPISNHRGTVATVDANGKNVVLSWVMDHRGGYALLMIDAETGKCDQFPIPFKNTKLDSPYASILSTANKFYTHFGDFFVEFDPIKRAFTFHHKTTPQMAMGMTEDDNGVIWSVTYPESGVAAFDPKTREFRDFGEVYKQGWPQYQRSVAADDTGHIYFGLGMTATQIVAFDPTTSKALGLVPDAERENGGTAYVYRNKNGKVYGQAQQGASKPWYELYKGKAQKIGDHTPDPKPIITGHQALFHQTFPDGKKIGKLDLVEREISVFDPATSTSKNLPFDYESEGALIMGVALTPDKTLSGGTAFPMRFFSYDPKSDEITNRLAYGQWNTVTTIGNKFFVGGYPSGFMLEWDPAKAWVNTDKTKSESNPRFLTQITPTVHRPHSLVALADESMVIMGGTPNYGLTGGGLLFWDRTSSNPVTLKHTDILPDHSTRCMIQLLPTNKLLAGTTTEAGTGGKRLAKEAELYIIDPVTKKVEWHAPVIPGTQAYIDLTHGPDGLIYGVADRKTFFAFDPVKKIVVHQQDISKGPGMSVSHQGSRIFPRSDDKIYILLEKAIGEIDQKTHTVRLLADSPVKLEGGGDYYDGRIYFFEGSHVYSYEVPKP